MIKLALFDIDGVLNNTERFSVRYTNKYNIPMETVLPFFTGVFQDCLVGKADLKEELAKVLDKWGYKGTVEELLRFWFEGEVNEDKKVREFIQKLKSEKLIIAASTNQEKYRTEYITKSLDLDTLFDHIYSSAYVGFKKPEREYFIYISRDLNIPFNEIVFWDDEQETVDSAKSLGIHAYLFEGIDKMKEQFESII
ncbi:HAD-IA family hydrolase [Candidatus Dojkabacteria bacterium]|uniref:HAD-IA family hydrolase n=1 Tax=Candidatus Dojkabacteria bacterium TaxID=2099670 RepID=A0A955L0N2_9BACT|nr:HAD-IA family hydrolase [Candidatus Dojkabacteria bacterium]